jgi:hypothetical protein
MYWITNVEIKYRINKKRSIEKYATFFIL